MSIGGPSTVLTCTIGSSNAAPCTIGSPGTVLTGTIGNAVLTCASSAQRASHRGPLVPRGSTQRASSAQRASHRGPLGPRGPLMKPGPLVHRGPFQEEASDGLGWRGGLIWAGVGGFRCVTSSIQGKDIYSIDIEIVILEQFHSNLIFISYSLNLQEGLLTAEAF